MKVKANIKQELEKLVKEGDNLVLMSKTQFISKASLDDMNKEETQKIVEIRKKMKFSEKYNLWYSEALEYVSLFTPARKSDFIELYRKKDDNRRTKLSVLNYGIQDALHNISNRLVNPSFATTLLEQQVNILKAVKMIYESAINNLIHRIQEEVLDDEINSAEKLIKINLRAAGALAGVILERHLKVVVEIHGIKVAKKNPTINDYNTLLKEKNVIELSEFRFIQYLADIRNVCDHSKKDDPKLENVKDLVKGVRKVLKTIL